MKTFVNQIKFIGLFLCCIISISCEPKELEKASDAYAIGDYLRSLKIYDEILDQNPSHFEARLGYSLSLYGQTQQLLENDAYKDSAKSMWLEVQNQIHILNQIKLTAKGNSLMSMCEYQLGDIALKEKKYAKAVDYFESAVKTDSLNIPALYARSNLYDAAGFTEPAQQFLAKIIKIDSTQALAYLDLGELYINEKDTVKALEIWKNGLRKNPNHEDLKLVLDEFRNQFTQNKNNLVGNTRGVAHE